MTRRFLSTLLIAAVLITGMALGSLLTGQTTRVQSQTFVDDTEAMFQQVYQQASPAVVALLVRVPADAQVSEFLPFADPAPGQDNQQPRYRFAEGSGFVYDDKGHIVTNAHVVEAADRIQAIFADSTTLNVEVVGAIADSDLAVLKYDTSKISVKPLTLADSDKIVVGTRAIAIGNPFGLAGSMTQGIISALNRRLPQESQFNIPAILQTDAAINPGNSGGPLLNTRGEVIGITTAIRSRAGQSSGIGFVIPSNIIKLIADQLIATGKVEISYLGISGRDLTADLAELMGLDTKTRGVLVASVPTSGPAAKAGIQPSQDVKVLDGEEIEVGGDVIQAVDGNPIRVFDDLLNYLFMKTKPGQVVKLSILRGSEKLDVEVTLTGRPASAQ